MRVAINQSDYLPWKGYFDIIHDVDLFVFYEDVQYTKNDWRNRNRIKTPDGVQWITIPVGARIHRLLCEVELPGGNWPVKHWKRIEAAYGKAPFFDRYAPFLRETYEERTSGTLSGLNRFLVERISKDFLGIRAEFRDSREFGAEGKRQQRVLDLLKKTGATTYVSGPAAKAYIDEERFEAEGIRIVWKDYGGYPEYEQPHPPFAHDVTVLDLLFSVGPEAPRYIWGWRG